MKKTKFFSEESIDKLQRTVNNWLSKNKAVDIMRTDMQVSTVGNKASYCFYILYEGIAMSAEMEIASEMEAMLPAGDVLPDVNPEDIIAPDKDIYNKV